jgi:hypothetical protein
MIPALEGVLVGVSIATINRLVKYLEDLCVERTCPREEVEIVSSSSGAVVDTLDDEDERGEED